MSVEHRERRLGAALRIAQVTATFPPYHGGTGNVCFHNARQLAWRGHSVSVFTAALPAALPGAASPEVRDGVTIRRLRPLLRIGNAPVLPALLHRLRGFDIVHLHYPFFGGELTALAAGLAGTPLVVTYHQDVFLHGVRGLVERVLRHTAGRLTLGAAARLLFTTLDYGRASYVWPLLHRRKERVDELPNGVDLHAFTPVGAPPDDLRARHGLASGERVALLVAGLDRAHYFKGVSVFLEALTRLPPAVKGVVVGDGDLQPVYAAAARDLGLEARVVFAGRVPDVDLPRYYRLADVTVLPSVTMGEAFGLVLVESMACGTPVVATALPGVRSVVDHGGDGLLVEPYDPAALGDAIRCLLDDDGARREMGRRGRAKVEERYSWERIGARLEEIYRQVLSREEELSQRGLRRLRRSRRLPPVPVRAGLAAAIDKATGVAAQRVLEGNGSAHYRPVDPVAVPPPPEPYTLEAQ